MRWINIAAALSGILALGMLVAAAHPLRDALAPVDLDRLKLAAFVQMGAACAGLAIANRSGRADPRRRGSVCGRSLRHLAQPEPRLRDGRADWRLNFDLGLDRTGVRQAELTRAAPTRRPVDPHSTRRAMKHRCNKRPVGLADQARGHR